MALYKFSSLESLFDVLNKLLRLEIYMRVSKIFKILIVAVICVLVGAIIINLLVPNVFTTMINSIEDLIFKATGLGFDFNGDGVMGDAGGNLQYTGQNADADGNGTAGNVEGFH